MSTTLNTKNTKAWDHSSHSNHVRWGGSKSASLLRTFCERRSGNWTLNSTIRSPRFVGCFGYGRPSPRILRTIPGWTTESPISSGIVRPPSVGMRTVLPSSACKSQYQQLLHYNVAWLESLHKLSATFLMYICSLKPILHCKIALCSILSYCTQIKLWF